MKLVTLGPVEELEDISMDRRVEQLEDEVEQLRNFITLQLQINQKTMAMLEELKRPKPKLIGLSH